MPQWHPTRWEISNRGKLIYGSIVVILIYTWNIQKIPTSVPSTNSHMNIENQESDQKHHEQIPSHYPPTAPIRREPPASSVVESKISDRGFWIGQEAKKMHNFDAPLALELVEIFKQEEISSILKFGGGTGAYARLFILNEFLATCYDGNPSTQENTNGSCGILDLSRPIQLAPHDWLVSLEVGEHIPREFEDTFLSNIFRHAKKGVVLSWAVEGQDGHGHVNNRNNDYIVNKFKEHDFESDGELQHRLRHASTLPWFKNTIMVFIKKKN